MICNKVSHPSWVRGLKLTTEFQDAVKEEVAPLVGAWIEIMMEVNYDRETIVAPLVGAWIEIKKQMLFDFVVLVAPLVGAWIEILIELS